ncbi:hypothetical protein P12x_003678 [Tundrisphaera lichenicola]|uniref:hypothetical protein n=1 Tax=Tundrisphaera lichenicola TaxID=2029860 RepID=UPI003EBA460E
MNNNWDQLIRAIVPLTFLAIWALTSLFNRESKAFPTRNPSGPPPGGPRPADPTMRWAPAGAGPNSGVRRVPIGDDDILIIQPDPARNPRPGQARPAQITGPRRQGRVRQATVPARKSEAPPSRPKLGGVSQNVNQHLANTVAMTPLTTIAPMATSTGSTLADAPSLPSTTTALIPTISSLSKMMNDPVRLREAFLVNELLSAPLALRKSRNSHR